MGIRQRRAWGSPRRGTPVQPPPGDQRAGGVWVSRRDGCFRRPGRGDVERDVKCPGNAKGRLCVAALPGVALRSAAAYYYQR